MSVAYAKQLSIPRSASVALAALVALAVVLTAPALAAADTRYVAAGGSNAANNCLVAQSPCLTIQHAVGAAANGDVVAIGAGLYSENVVVEKSLTLRGVAPVADDPEQLLDAGALTTELKGSGGAPALTLKSPVDTQPALEIAVEDLRIDGNANFGAVQIESNEAGGKVRVRSVAFDGVAIVGSPSAINTAGFKPVHGFVLEHSAIRCTGALNATGGVLLGVADGGQNLPVAVTDNYMTECGAAINAGDHTGFAGTTGSVAGEATISGNTIEDNRWGCILIALAYEDLTIEDNTLSDCDLQPNAWDSAINLQSTPGPTSVTTRGNQISGEDANVGIIVQNVTAHGDAPNALASFAIEDNTIEGLTVGTTSVGVRIGPTVIQRSADNIEVSVIGNTLIGNSRGFDWQTNAGNAVGENLVLRGNRFANVERGISLFGADRELDAEGNWWGCNEGPLVQAAGKTPDGCDTIGVAVPATSSVDADPWLVLSLEADPTQIGTGGKQATLRAAVESDSDGGAANPPLPDGTPVEFATSLGLLGDASAPLLAGATTTTLTSGAAAGTATVTASLDGEDATTAVQIVAPPPPVEDPAPPPPAEPPASPQPTTTKVPAGVQVTTHRQPHVGTLTCEEGCHVAARYGTARVGSKKFNVKVRVRSSIEPGGSAKIRVVLPRWVRRELAEAGIAAITVRLRVVNPDGTVTVHRARVKISPPRAA